MFIKFKKDVSSVLEEALRKLEFEAESLMLEGSAHADIASSVAYGLASKYKKNPVGIAKQIYEAIIVPENSLIGEVTIKGPYINFNTNRRYLIDTIYEIRSGIKAEPKGHLILEHTSANPNGPLHVGHIRNSCLGDTLGRILRRAGYDVDVQYYVNDMGRQMAIVVWAADHYGLDPNKKTDHAIADAYIEANRALKENPELVAEIDVLMQKGENGDSEVCTRFSENVGLAVDGIKATLKRMNISHDRFVNESSFIRDGSVQEIMDAIKKTNRLSEEEGALVVDLSDSGFEKGLVVGRSNNTSLYVTRDLAYHKWKAQQAERNIDILGADHKLISSQLRATLRLIGVQEPEVVIFEFVSLPEGSMSTRAGKFISADELLDKIEEQAYIEVNKRRDDITEAEMRNIARIVGIGAVRYDIIRISPDKSTVFDWNAALDFEKQGAPFIQYSHTRAGAIIRNAKAQGCALAEAETGCGLGSDVLALLTETQEVALIKTLARFMDVIDNAAESLKAHSVATYAREVAESFNQFYRDSPVLSAEGDVRAARLCLVECSRIILGEMLEVLGIEAPESM